MTCSFATGCTARVLRATALALFRPVRRYWSAYSRRLALRLVPLATETASREGERVTGVLAPVQVELSGETHSFDTAGTRQFPVEIYKEVLSAGAAADADWAHWVTASQPLGVTAAGVQLQSVQPVPEEIGFVLYSLRAGRN